MIRSLLAVGLMVVLAFATTGDAADLSASLKKGTADLKSAGPLAFAPEGILLVGDPVGAAVFAIATEDTSGNREQVKHDVKGIDQKVAAALGVSAEEISINDLAINPASGNAYLSVSRGRGPDAPGVIVRVDGSGKISELSLQGVRFAKSELPNAPAPGKGKFNQRAEAITDLAYIDGRVIVAGLSNEEFASNLRSIPFPFETANQGAGVEIFHGAHGRFETRSPVRTFAIYEIGDQPHVLAAYTCTPLVKFPLSELKPGEKVKGTTVAELGNGNRPLDMVIYQDGGKDYILLTNNKRGVMKISTENIERKEGITKPVERGGKEGQPYETITELKNIEQLDRLNKGHAAVIARGSDGALSLQTIALP